MKKDKICFEEISFDRLIKEDEELAAIREEFAEQSPRERRQAADWEYHSQIAAEAFNRALILAGEEDLGASVWPPGVLPLAIDPLYAPALLTVGSLEYQVGREDEAMCLFMKLTTLPEDTEDLSVIIDKAGDFLLDEDDVERALSLFAAAEESFPSVTVYSAGSGYCLAKLGRYEEALDKARKSDALEPDNYLHLNDLGWSLVEAGYFDEAEEVLQRSIALAPEDYAFARNNLEQLKKRRAKGKGKYIRKED